MGKNETILNTDSKTGYEEPAVQTNWQTFHSVITSRRSVRIFEPTPIPDQVVHDCLQAALLAPNSSNLQPWEFYRVRTSGKRAAMVKACFGQNAAKTAPELIVCVARTKTWKRNRDLLMKEMAQQGEIPAAVRTYYHSLIPMMYMQGPLSLLGFVRRLSFSIVGLFRPVPREPASHADMKIWAVKSTALACENLMLALRAHGYDSCPMEGFDSSRVKKILGLPRDAVIVMVIGAGLRAPNGVYAPRARMDERNFLFEV